MDLRNSTLAGSQTASGRTAGCLDSGDGRKAKGYSNSGDGYGLISHYSDSRDEPGHSHRDLRYSNSGEGSVTRSYSRRIGGNSATYHGSEGRSKCPPFKLKDRPSSKYAFLALKPIDNKWKTIGTL